MDLPSKDIYNTYNDITSYQAFQSSIIELINPYSTADQSHKSVVPRLVSPSCLTNKEEDVCEHPTNPTAKHRISCRRRETFEVAFRKLL